MFKKNESKDNNNISNTILSAKTKFVGNIRFQGCIQINGKVIGNITSDDNSSSIVTVSSTGTVTGDIHAPIVNVSGNITGNIYSCKSLKLSNGAHIDGDLSYNIIEIEAGSKIKGSLKHSYSANDNTGSTINKNIANLKLKETTKEAI